MRPSLTHVVSAASLFFGGGSLLAFGAFLFSGSFALWDLGLGAGAAVVWDAVICLPFFLFHSVLIRPRVRRWLSGLIPPHWYGATYSILSGIALFAVVALWQTTDAWAWRIPSPVDKVIWAVFFATGIGFLYSAKALKDFDPLGIRQVSGHGGQGHRATAILTVTGPYRWVRHPLYFLAILLIWAHPAITTDRLMFNMLWTLWIVVGAHFEERDLMARFGRDYWQYQKCVPMLMPYRRPCRSQVPCRHCAGRS
jgi:protein-S-isoprenylcysteine O-methyltransferase Ste14